MTTYPCVKVDLKHRMLSVLLNERKIAWTDQIDDAHLVDIDADGRVVGFEILTLDDLKVEAMADRFGLNDQLPEIRAAIQRSERDDSYGRRDWLAHGRSRNSRRRLAGWRHIPHRQFRAGTG